MTWRKWRWRTGHDVHVARHEYEIKSRELTRHARIRPDPACAMWDGVGTPQDPLTATCRLHRLSSTYTLLLSTQLSCGVIADAADTIAFGNGKRKHHCLSVKVVRAQAVATGGGDNARKGDGHPRELSTPVCKGHSHLSAVCMGSSHRSPTGDGCSPAKAMAAARRGGARL
ncbi:hypothetical protein BHM03_00021577 [Ensete ventricosum]|nr:hypothetical protein BHM03_00021577 [Ensete ventricosum]